MFQVVAANMVREIWEDSKRHKDDRDVNHRIVEVVKEGKITEVKPIILFVSFGCICYLESSITSSTAICTLRSTGKI